MHPPYIAGSSTSEAAACAIKPTAGTLREVVLAVIRHAGLDGITDEEGIALTGMNASTYRPRRIECHEKGLIIDYGERRRTASGRSAVVWFAVKP